MKFSRGPAVILNSGSLDNCFLSKKDKFGRYVIQYVVGIGNRSFVELKRITEQLMADNGMTGKKFPWTVNEATNMVTIQATSKIKVPIVGAKTLGDGDFCKVNVTPSAYSIQERSVFRLPDGSTGEQFTAKSGVKLFLNGLKAVEQTEVEDLF